MVEVVVNVGEKGQVLIPKVLRDQFGIFPGQSVLLEEIKEGVLVRSVSKDPIELFRKTAAEIKAKKTDVHAIEQEYEYRLRKAGIRV